MPTPSSTPRPRRTTSPAAASKSAPKADAETTTEPPAVDKPEGPTPSTPSPVVASSPRWIAEPGIRPASGDYPCRDCFPAGPPAGAGTIGCVHGNWVYTTGGG